MFSEVSSIFALLVLLVEEAQECLAIGEWRLRLNSNSRGDQNALERKDVFVFVNKVDCRDLVLDNTPPKQG